MFMKNAIFIILLLVLLFIFFGMRYILNWISDSSLQIILLSMIILTVIVKEKLNITFFK